MKLRKYRSEDADDIVSWFHEETTFFMWSANKFGKYPITATEFDEFYQRMQYQSGEFQAFIVENEEHDKVVHFFLWKVEETDVTVRLGFLVVNDTYRGKGYLREAMKLAECYARDTMGMEELVLGVFENNVHAQKCYEALGFEYDKEQSHGMTIKDEEWIGYEMHKKLI